jgi:hypothetical protein
MGRKATAIFFLSFVGTVICAGYGIFQLGKLGGPCNAGIAIIVLIPFLVVCAALLLSTSPWLMFREQEDFIKPILYTFSSLLIWTYWIYSFLQDDGKNEVLYLGPFELINIFLLIIYFIRQIKVLKGRFTNSAR